MEVHHLDVDGQQVAYQKRGSGRQAVVVMHGWGCRASTVDLLAGAATTAGTTVYNLDLPGFGDSPEPTQVWSVYDYARCVRRFCEKLGLERPVLMGHSFGGRLAIILGGQIDPAKVILVDAAGIKPRRTLKYYFKVYSFKLAKRLAPIFLGRERGGRLIEKMRGRSGSSDYASASPRMRAIMSRVVNEDLSALAPAIKAPTLLIWGAKDTATPLADAKKLEKLIPDAGLVVYPEAGHYSFLERPGQTAAVIQSFLNV